MAVQRHLSRREFLKVTTEAAVFAAIAGACAPAIKKPTGYSPLVERLPMPYAKIRAYMETHTKFEGWWWPVKDLAAGNIVDCDPTNNVDTLMRLPYEKIAIKLGLEHRKDVRVLYPGAGAHLAALEIGNGLTRVSPSLVRALYVFTEMENGNEKFDVPAGMGINEYRFENIIKPALPEFQLLDKEKYVRERGFEVCYRLLVFGKEVRLTYAINRSEPQTDAVNFRKEYAAGADIVMFHDSYDSASVIEHPSGIATAAMSGAGSERQKAVIFEDVARVMNGKNKQVVYSILPGEIELVEGSYGCPMSKYNGAVIYFPDVAAMAKIQREGSFDKLVDTITSLYTFR